MKKILLTLFCFFSFCISFELFGMRPGYKTRGITSFRGDSDDDIQEYPFLSEREGESSSSKSKRAELIKDEIKRKREASEDYNELQEELDAILLPNKKYKHQGAKETASLAFTDALLYKKRSLHDQLPRKQVVLYALLNRSVAPLGKVIEKRSERFWDYLFDKLENGVISVTQFFGFVPTISVDDIELWKNACSDLATNYKELRKGIENSESRSTSMQLRSILTDSFDDEKGTETTTQVTIIDDGWITLRQGHFILFDTMLEKLQTYFEEANVLELEASIRRLISDVQGLRGQLESAQTLADLINPTRTHLMNSYFASIDSGLRNLGALIDPLYEQKAKKKTQGGFGFGGNDSYYNDY